MATLLQKCLAECLGVYILCSFGNGAVAQTLLYSGDKAGLLDIHLAYGMAVTLAVYVTGKVSGAHLNPAVTLAECVFGRFEWRHAPHYFIAQIMGGFISSVIVWLVYMDMEKDMTTAGIFATYPRDDISLMQALIDEIIGTIMLVLCLHALVDNENGKPPPGFEPFFVGVTVFTIGAAFGINTGYAINPARDLGPRLFTLVAGWGSEVFQRGNNKFDYYFWIPIVGPLIGGLMGAYLYKFIVGNVLTGLKEKLPSSRNSEELKAGIDFF